MAALATHEPGVGMERAMKPQPRRTAVMRAEEVVNDETLHPGAVVWLGSPRLTAIEQARFDVARRRCRPLVAARDTV